MALARIKTWGSEVLTSSDLNSEFNNILNNALSLVSPLTGDLAFGGNRATGLHLGTAGSPSVQATGATNLGIFFPSTSTIGFSTSGTERVRINGAFSLLLRQATGDYTVSWSDPAAARALTIPDPGGADTFAFVSATQTFTNKTLTTPTIAATGFTNANHAHAAANSGGQLDHTAALTNVGTNTHAQIDTHIAASAAVHGLPASVNVVGNRNASGEFFQRMTVDPTAAGAGDIGNLYRIPDTAFTWPVAFSTTPYVAAGGCVTANAANVVMFGARAITTTGGTFAGLTSSASEDLGNCQVIGLGT